MIEERRSRSKGEKTREGGIEMNRFALAVALLLGHTLVTQARAGVVDTPLPAPFTRHVFTVPGVINSGGIGAFFSCTNLDAVNVTIGVEIFGSAGGAAINDAAGTSLSVLPGATVTLVLIRTTALEVS
jgi:hypothetical protein